jgi:hypothetical protein
MPADLAASAYLVDGVPLAATGVKLTHDGSGLWSGASEALSLTTFPGSDKGSIDGGVFQPYTLSTMYEVRAAGFKAVWAAAWPFGAAASRADGDPHPDHAGPGRDRREHQSHHDGSTADRPPGLAGPQRAAARHRLADQEAWHGAPVTIASGTGAQTILGDIRTRRMTITLNAGAARTISNNQRLLLPVPGHRPDRRCADRRRGPTATAITGGADMSRLPATRQERAPAARGGLQHPRHRRGTFSVSYQPAYL